MAEPKKWSQFQNLGSDRSVIVRKKVATVRGRMGINMREIGRCMVRVDSEDRNSNGDRYDGSW